MENRIPLPTDSIYKFYALFGLLLVVFSIGGTIYVNKSTNDLVFDIAVEHDTLKFDSLRSVSQEARFQVLQKKIEIAGKNKNFFIFGLSAVFGVGVLMVLYGFRKWHTQVQPIQDEIARLSLKKLKRELGEDEDA